MLYLLRVDNELDVNTNGVVESGRWIRHSSPRNRGRRGTFLACLTPELTGISDHLGRLSHHGQHSCKCGGSRMSESAVQLLDTPLGVHSDAAVLRIVRGRPGCRVRRRINVGCFKKIRYLLRPRRWRWRGLVVDIEALRRSHRFGALPKEDCSSCPRCRSRIGLIPTVLHLLVVPGFRRDHPGDADLGEVLRIGPTFGTVRFVELLPQRVMLPNPSVTVLQPMIRLRIVERRISRIVSVSVSVFPGLYVSDSTVCRFEVCFDDWFRFCCCRFPSECQRRRFVIERGADVSRIRQRRVPSVLVEPVRLSILKHLAGGDVMRKSPDDGYPVWTVLGRELEMGGTEIVLNP